MTPATAIARAQAALDAHDAPACGKHTSGRAGMPGHCGLPVDHQGACREVSETDGWDELRDLLRVLTNTNNRAQRRKEARNGR